MTDDLTHASWFSGVGGVDLGLERAGWRTVSHSEIDPYAGAVLAERWPGVPNLGDITVLADGNAARPVRASYRCLTYVVSRRNDARCRTHHSDDLDWTRAALWTGGFPCQDLSVAGKRRGLVGARSGLAFAFLALVERHRPPWLVMENVPGLLSSHAGRDLGTLLGTLGELGYGWAYRILDARYFGVAQRRRRVFIVGSLGSDGASEVLLEPESGAWHPAPRREARTGAAGGAGGGAEVAGSPIVAGAIAGNKERGGWRAGPDEAAGNHLVMAPAFSKRPGQQIATRDDGLSYALGAGEPPRVLSRADGIRELGRVDPAGPDHGITARSAGRGDEGDGTNGQHGAPSDAGRVREAPGLSGRLDRDLLPKGLDSHRYRVLGNAVCVPVAEWLGWRLRHVIEREVAA